MKNSKKLQARAVRVAPGNWEVHRGKEVVQNDIGSKFIAKATAKILNRPGPDPSWNKLFSMLVHEFGFTPREVLLEPNPYKNDDNCSCIEEFNANREMDKFDRDLLRDADDHLDEDDKLAPLSQEEINEHNHAYRNL